MPLDKPTQKTFAIVLGAVILWFVAYNLIQSLADWLTYSLFRIDQGSHLGESVAFFLYDVPKILLLLSGMIFLITLLRGFFSPEQARTWLGGKREGVGNLLAALLGVVTPFCSCSAVPLFIGFVRSGVPLGVTFSYLIAAPTINEVAVVLLFGLFGWKVAGLYVASGLVIATVSGVIIGRLKMEKHVEDFVWKGLSMLNPAAPKPSWNQRIDEAWASTIEIVGKVWLYVIIGIAIGAGIHGYMPESALTTIMGKDAWWSVPAAVMVGIPLYSNAAGVIPIVSALMEKGASLGTVLAFMMSVVGLSLPEVILLKQVLKPRLITVFVGVIAAAIIFTGYLFNILF